MRVPTIWEYKPAWFAVPVRLVVVPTYAEANVAKTLPSTYSGGDQNVASHCVLLLCPPSVRRWQRGRRRPLGGQECGCGTYSPEARKYRPVGVVYRVSAPNGSTTRESHAAESFGRCGI